MYTYDTLLIGGTGFIGEYLASELLDRKKRVAIIHKNSVKRNVAEPIFFVRYDDSIDSIEKVVKESRQIVFMTQPDPHLLRYVLNSIDKTKLVTLLYISTSMVYKSGIKPRKETDKILPITSYAKQKYKEENIILKYANSNRNIKVIIARLGNVYGDIKNRGMIALALRSIFERKDFVIAGNGKQVRDFIFVDDVAKALVKLLGKKIDKKITIVNVATGISYRLIEVIQKIENITKRNILYHLGPPIKETIAVKCDISKLKDLLDWYPKTSLDKGLQKTYKRFIVAFTERN